MATETYYGIEATSDIYGFPVDHDSRSGIFVQIAHSGEGPISIQNGINAGWHVCNYLFSYIDVELCVCPRESNAYMSLIYLIIKRNHESTAAPKRCGI